MSRTLRQCIRLPRLTHILAPSTALLVLGVARTASGEVLLFDFESAPLGNDNSNPTYVQGDFTLSHVTVDPPANAHAERVQTTRKPDATNQYAMRVIALSKKSTGPLTIEVTFSEPVVRVSMVVRNSATSGNAVITPILGTPFPMLPSASAPHSHCPAGSQPTSSLDVPYTQGQYVECVLEEFPNNAYWGFRVTAGSSDKFYWDDLRVETAECDPASASCFNLPLFPTDAPETFLTLTRLRVNAQIEAAGFYNLNSCVFRDIREDEGEKRDLLLAEVVGTNGTGTCTGEYWASFIVENPNLVIEAMFESFAGAFEGEPGYWIQLLDTSFTGAFHGPVLTTSFAEDVIDFPITLPQTELPCAVGLSWRPLTLAFDNPLSGKANNRTVRCNRPESMTRRTIQTMPLRLAGTPLLDELENIFAQTGAALRAVDEAKECANHDTPIEAIRLYVLEGKAKLLLGHVDNAISLFQQAQIDSFFLDLTPCDASLNLIGELASITGALAFTAFDRVKNFNPDTWEKYDPPVPPYNPLP